MTKQVSQHIDPERLAALIDGRLSADERAALLAQVADDEGAQALLADAAAVTRELEVETTSDVAVHTRARRSWFRPGWMALAAGIVAVVALQVARPKGDTVQQLVDGIDVRAAGTSTLELRPWSTTRGPEEVVSVDALPWRIGVRLVDLEVAADAGNENAAVVFGAELARLLEQDTRVSPPTRSVFMDRSNLGAAGEKERAQARAEIRTAIRDLSLELGAWTEGARYAAAQQRASYFGLSKSRATIAWLRANGQIAPRAADLMEAAARGRVLSAAEWGEVSRELTGVLAER